MFAIDFTPIMVSFSLLQIRFCIVFDIISKVIKTNKTHLLDLYFKKNTFFLRPKGQSNMLRVKKNRKDWWKSERERKTEVEREKMPKIKRQRRKNWKPYIYMWWKGRNVVFVATYITFVEKHTTKVSYMHQPKRYMRHFSQKENMW